MLEVRGLQVRYGKTVAVRGADVRVGRGQVVGVVGESGSGKTSLGFATVGLAPISAGSVWFDGEDITAATGRRRRELSRRMQVVFQDPYGSMNPARTIGDTLGEGLRYGAAMPARLVRDQVAEVLAEVGLPASAAARHPAQFSSGQRQRIAIARAIVRDPDFVVCDEAVSALDLSVQAQVLNLLSRLRASRQLSFLFISHDLSVVRYLSDEIVVMYRGQVVERGPAAAMSGTAAHPYTRALVAAVPIPDPARQAAARLSRPQAAKPAANGNGCVFAARCPYARQRCLDERPILTEHAIGHHVACHRHREIPNGESK
ncbi:dipeptide ABC transporter ATP-binding protein [Fodinicola feengrottensis]|uniref:Dipeptide ABC transporter ATP-binding protein n=1 Tax=Fodinicola feengrottensis TaxID=435914 RepID=A0ABP4UTW3_9ACTN